MTTWPSIATDVLALHNFEVNGYRSYGRVKRCLWITSPKVSFKVRLEVYFKFSIEVEISSSSALLRGTLNTIQL